MDLASAVLSGTTSFVSKLPISVSTPHIASLPLGKNPARNPCFKLRVLRWSVYKPSLRHLPGATADNTASLPHEQEDLSGSDGAGSFDHIDSITKTVNETKGEASGSRSWSEEEMMVRVCDELIATFMVDKPTPNDWRKLIAFSRTWDVIRPHFFRRCQERADSVDDPGMKHQLLRFSRILKEVDDDVQRHTELLEVVKQAPSETDIHEVITMRRKDFTHNFFVHVHNVAESYYYQPSEQDAIAKLRDMCWEAVRAYDTTSNSQTVNDACMKIEDLAAKKQVDSALELMITKARSDGKESTIMKDEAKDIMYDLYKTTVDDLERQVPNDVHILEYLLMIEDPLERVSVLEDAFTPGEEGNESDALYTSPEELHEWIETVLAAYYHQSSEETLIKEVRDLMNPEIIAKIEDIKQVLEAQYL